MPPNMPLAFLTVLFSSIVTATAGLAARGQAAFNAALVPGIAHPAYLDLDTGASLAAYEYGNTSKKCPSVTTHGQLRLLCSSPVFGHCLTIELLRLQQSFRLHRRSI